MLLLLTLPGTPSIYYGDELGLEGGPDPGCRAAYPVALDADQQAMRAFTRAVVRARRDRRALRRGTAAVAAAAGQAIAIARQVDGDRALVAVNSGREPARLDVDPAAIEGLTALDIPEIATGRTMAGAAMTTIELPPQGALVLG
jgi:neopullulanase